MRIKFLLFTLAFISLSYTGIVVAHTVVQPSLEQEVHSILSQASNPNDVYRAVRFNPLSYASVTVQVALHQLNVQWHVIAHRQFIALYPHYKQAIILRVSYSALGLNRYYTFRVSHNSKEEECQVAIKVHSEFTKSNESEDELQGYSQVSVQWVQRDPTASHALQVVIKQNWNTIKAYPLRQCWQKPVRGVWSFRFYFTNVTGRFEYSVGQIKAVANSEVYYAEVEPVYVVGDVAQYKNFSIEQFKKSPAYNKVVEELTKNIGHFEQAWILHVSISVTNGVNYIKVVVNFQPFLLKQTYEAHYFGSVEKASLLKVDQKVFNPTGRSFENWQEIKDFRSLKAFDQAYQCITHSFTWLRFYKVVAAYSALHKKGRSIRLVFAGIGEFVDPKNQINIVVFVDQFGKYFFDRNDFHATHLNSFGRNNWVSLFVSTPDVTKAQYYQNIVKFFQSIYPKYWSVHQLVDIKFKGNLHVITFQNPTNEKRIGVLDIKQGGQVTLLNNHTWIRLQEDSPLAGRLEKFVRGKYEVSKIMFVQFKHSDDGTHFEIGYLNVKDQYRACYILYIDQNDVFIQSKEYRYDPIIFDSDTYLHPLPKDVQASVIAYLVQQKIHVVAVLGFIQLSRYQFAIVALMDNERWQINLKWQKGVWGVVSKVPYNDGYFTAYGYPSVTVASCTGFLAKLYPVHFSKPYLYMNIQTKSVGVSLYHRIVYDFGDKSYEASVELTFGVKNSHIHHYWMPVSYYNRSHDYGYGSVYDYIYGSQDSSLISKVEVKRGSSLTKQSQESAEPVIAVAQRAISSESQCAHGSKPDIFTGICIPIF